MTLTITVEENYFFITIKAACNANIKDVNKAIDMIDDKKEHII